MRVTKYPQSCMVLDKDGRIAIDIGTLATDSYSLDDLGELQAVFYTHRHPDHFDPAKVEELLERGVTLYGNADVCQVIGEDDATPILDGQTVDVCGFTITARDLPHFPMVNGSAGPPNTGFLIDDFLFHPGDGIQLPGLTVNTLAVPIAGPSISFRDAYSFVESVGAKTAIAMHYDFFLAKPELFAERCDIAEVLVMNPGETISL